MFRVHLQEGIVGGFAGPRIRQVIEIKGDASGAKLQQSTPKDKFDFHTLSGQVDAQEVKSLLAELKSGLADLPVEDPVGSEDIYRLDTAIQIFSDEFTWANGGPEGCGRQESSVQATEQQKAIFKALVDRIKQLPQTTSLSIEAN